MYHLHAYILHSWFVPHVYTCIKCVMCMCMHTSYVHGSYLKCTLVSSVWCVCACIHHMYMVCTSSVQTASCIFLVQIRFCFAIYSSPHNSVTMVLSNRCWDQSSLDFKITSNSIGGLVPHYIENLLFLNFVQCWNKFCWNEFPLHQLIIFF